MERAEAIRGIRIEEGYPPAEWCRPEWRAACRWKDEGGAKIYIA